MSVPVQTSRRLNSIVTGGSGILGSAIISALVKRGDNVVCLDKNTPERTDIHFVPVDISNTRSVELAMQEAVEHLGYLDVLVNAAGIIQISSFLNLNEDDFESLLNVNLLGAFRVAQAGSKHMLENGGKIVFVTSIHGQVGVQGRSAYAASKGGVASLARVIAAELAQYRIRVNVLAPGAIDGGMLPDPNARQGWVKATPSNRVAYLEEVAGVAVMLTSENASFVNGQIIAVDGGVSTIRRFE